MADTQAETPQNNAVPPLQTAEPKPVGRPQGSKTKAVPPPPPAKDDATEDFFLYMQSLPKEDWSEKLLAYLYRTGPQINMGKKGEWRIERYARAIDSQDVMEQHGSGSYKIMLTKYDPTTNQSKLLRTHYFSIVNMNYPPRVPMGTWVDKPENAEWLWAKPYIEAEYKKSLTAAGGASVSSEAALFREAVAAVQSLRPNQSAEEQTSLAQLVIQSMQRSSDQMLALANPSQMLSMVDKIIAAVTPKEEAGGGVLMTLITGQLTAVREELAEERKFNRDLLTKLSTPAPAPPPAKSLREELHEIKDVAQELGLNRGSNRNPGTDWGGVATEVGKEFLKTLGTVAQAFAMRPQQPGRPAGRTVTVDNTRRLPGIGETTAPNGTAAPASTGEETMDPTRDAIQKISNQYGGLFDMAAPFLVDHFKKGFSGMEFREWFRETYGTFTYDGIRQMSKEALIDVIELRKTQAPQHVAEQLVQLAPPEHVAEFVEEFLSDRPVDEVEEEPTAPAPAAAPPAKNPASAEEF